MAKVLSFLGQKGGGGKTTLAINVAYGFHLMGKKVLIVDQDTQGSALDWSGSNEGSLIRVDRFVDFKSQQSYFMENYDIVIIDGMPGLADPTIQAIKLSDFVLIPIKPGPFDSYAAADIANLIKMEYQDRGIKFFEAAFVITSAIKNSKLLTDIAKSLEEYGLPIFRSFTTHRVSYPTSAALGLSVYNTWDKEARSEISAIIKEIDERYEI